MKVSEVFRSLQGETTRAGEPAVFVRLAGCNLDCTWCDTAHAQSGGRPMSIARILAAVEALPPTPLVCVTGGEPMIQRDTPALLAALLGAGRDVQLMTNGSVALDLVPAGVSRVVDVKSPWAHRGDLPPPGGPVIAPPHLLPSNLALLGPPDEVKVVVRTRPEFDWAAGWLESAGLFGRVRAVLVAPAWGHLEPALLADWILESGLPIRLNLQVHKMLWGGDTRL